MQKWHIFGKIKNFQSQATDLNLVIFNLKLLIGATNKGVPGNIRQFFLGF